MRNFIICLFAIAAILTEAYGQTSWEKDPNNPVLPRGTAGAWDDVAVGSPSVIYDGALYHMWYNGSDGSSTNIGYASSPDKINWEKHTAPVLENGPGGSWDDLFILHPSVYFDGTNYHMWYTGSNGSVAQIGYATSPDSINWAKHSGNPVFTPGESGEWDDQFVAEPDVLFIDGVFHLWYGGTDGIYRQTGHATSLDGITWDRDELNPVLKVGEVGSWDNFESAQPSVLYDGTNYRMFYSGGPSLGWKIGYAFSEDGRIWHKDSVNNPVIEQGLTGSWDSESVGYHNVCFNSDSTGFDMWYTGADAAAFGGNIGYATAPVTSIETNNLNVIPNEFSLSQNYPNPFNPSTKIIYSVPQSSKIVIKVFDFLGNEIKTLVNEEKASGTYELTWNSVNLPSGVYFYQLQANNSVETKKMLLLK
jgi:predicted GH43/DUF377 family glycosyl hydrolase